MDQLRHLSSTDIYAAKYSRVSVSIPEAGCGDHTLTHNGFTLKSDVIERSPLLQSLLCTKGETCVPISSDHFHIWATYEPASTVEASSLIPILEVAVFLQDADTVLSTSQRLACMFRAEWRKSMTQSPTELLPYLPWPSNLSHPHCHTTELSALISGLMSLQPPALHSVLSHLLPSELHLCPQPIRAMAIAVRMRHGVLDLTGILAPVFTSREHLTKLRDQCTSDETDGRICSTCHMDVSDTSTCHMHTDSTDPWVMESCDISMKANDPFSNLNHCHRYRAITPSNATTLPHLYDNTSLSQSPKVSDASSQYTDSPTALSSPSSAFRPHLTLQRPLSHSQEPASFLTSSWLSLGLSSPFLLPSAPCLTLQQSDLCYDVFTLLPKLLESFARSGMQLPRVSVTMGQTWPPPSDADMLATVPFLFALQPLFPTSLELSGIPLYLSDASSWAPALSRMTQLTRLELKLDTWKVLPARTLAASSTAMQRLQQYRNSALAHCHPLSLNATVQKLSPLCDCLDATGAAESPRVFPDSDLCASPSPSAAAGDQTAMFNSWMHAKAESARDVARHLGELSSLRHLAMHSCSCEWTALTIATLSCARHLSHLELHWIDNAQSAARHMVPALVGLVSAACAPDAGSRRSSGAMSVDAGGSADAGGSPGGSAMSQLSDQVRVQLEDGHAAVAEARPSSLQTLILCQVPSSSKQFSPGSGCLCDPSANPDADVPAALGPPGALNALLTSVPPGALAHLQQISLAGLCVGIDELDVLVVHAPQLKSLTLPQTATLRWLRKLAPLPLLQELCVEYIPETSVHRAAEALAAAGVPAGPPAAMHGEHALPGAPTATTLSLQDWLCCGRMRTLEVRRRRTLCRGHAFVALAPQLGAFVGLTRLVWTEPLPGRGVPGDWQAVFAASLGSLRQLEHLEVAARHDGETAGAAQFPHALARLSRLTYLSMSVCELAGLVSAVAALTALQGLMVKGLVRQEGGLGVVELLDALPALRYLTSLRMSEKRSWPKLPPCSQRRVWRGGRGVRGSGGEGMAHGGTARDAPVRVASACEHPATVCRAVQARSRLLRAVRGKLGGLVEAPQLRALRLEMPYMGDVIEEVAAQLAVMRGLQRLELAALGGVYQHAKRVLWPHVLGLPLQEGVRLW